MLEAHPREKSIIVNYKLEAAVYGEGDVVDPMLADKKVSLSRYNNKSRLVSHFWMFQCHNNRIIYSVRRLNHVLFVCL